MRNLCVSNKWLLSQRSNWSHHVVLLVVVVVEIGEGGEQVVGVGSDGGVNHQSNSCLSLIAVGLPVLICGHQTWKWK
jgi:hypothetical protein